MSPFETAFSFMMTKLGVGAVTFPTEPMFSSSLPIRPAKLKDIMTLSEKYIPTEYQGFHSSLTAGEVDRP